ncbi:DMT family transporter [Thermodesulfatator indicus]
MNTYKADFLLLLAAIIWGGAFVAQRMGMDHIGPLWFNGIRFGLGCLSLLPLIWYRRKKGITLPFLYPTNRNTFLKAGFLVGTLLFLASILQQVGIVYTTAGKAGFITGLYVVMVPLLGLFWKQRPGLGVWIGVILAATGLYFLSITEEFTIAYGDFLVFLCAMVFSLHVLAIGWFAPRVDCIELASFQFGLTSILSLWAALFLEDISWQALKGAVIPILYGGFMSAGIAFTLQIVAQRDAPPAHAAIIMSLESVFAALAGWFILGETLNVREIFGCILMFAGMLTAQLWPLLRNHRAEIST